MVVLNVLLYDRGELIHQLHNMQLISCRSSLTVYSHGTLLWIVFRVSYPYTYIYHLDFLMSYGNISVWYQNSLCNWTVLPLSCGVFGQQHADCSTCGGCTLFLTARRVVLCCWHGSAALGLCHLLHIRPLAWDISVRRCPMVTAKAFCFTTLFPVVPQVPTPGQPPHNPHPRLLLSAWLLL